MDVMFVTIQILLVAVSLMGLKAFTMGQGKKTGRMD